MSRIRQIKPSWFLDKDLHRGASADAREFYIGLWMLADDAGWMVWDVERIAAELYPYEALRRRERNVTKWSETLATLDSESPHLQIFDCGHACVPKMAAHQRIAGKVSVGIRDKHREMCRGMGSQLRLTMATERGEPKVATDSHGRVGNGKERNGSALAPEGDGAARSEFREKVSLAVALGGKP